MALDILDNSRTADDLFLLNRLNGKKYKFKFKKDKIMAVIVNGTELMFAGGTTFSECFIKNFNFIVLMALQNPPDSWWSTSNSNRIQFAINGGSISSSKYCRVNYFYSYYYKING